MQVLPEEALAKRAMSSAGGVRYAATAFCDKCGGSEPRGSPDRFYLFIKTCGCIDVICSNCWAAWQAPAQSTPSYQRSAEAVANCGHESGDLVSEAG